MPYPKTWHFHDRDRHGDDILSVVVIDQPVRGLFTAYLKDDVNEEDGRVRIYGKGDTEMAAIADLNRELAQVE
jgi:hypothetical protein